MSLMVALHYLKSRDDLSDEVVLAQWVENLSWQHFVSGHFKTGQLWSLQNQPL
jgi:hypothetical protein